MKNILIYRLGHLGDTIVALPVFKIIRANYPDARIALLYNQTNNGMSPLDILSYTNFIDASIPYLPQGKLAGLLELWRKLRYVGYDVVINLPSSRRSRCAILRDKLFFSTIGAKKLVGFELPGKISRNTAVQETDFLLQRAFVSGLTVPDKIDSRSMLQIAGNDQYPISLMDKELPGWQTKKLVAFCVGSNMPAKCWPLDNYSLLGEKLINKFSIIPILFGGVNDKASGDQLVKAWGAGINFAGRLSVIQSYYMLGKCRFYVGNDTGAMHFAALAGIKCVGIFSARDTKGRWDPYGKGHIVIRKEPACQNCMRSVCERHNMCINEISVQEVFKACSQLIGRAN